VLYKAHEYYKVTPRVKAKNQPLIIEEARLIAEKSRLNQGRWNEVKLLLEQGVFDKHLGIKRAEKEIAEQEKGYSHLMELIDNGAIE